MTYKVNGDAMRGFAKIIAVVMLLQIIGCQVKQEAAPSNATSLQVWSVLNGNDCFWTGRTKDGEDLMIKFSNHNGQWYAMADRARRHFFPTDVSVNEQEARFTISNSAEAGIGGLGEVLVEMLADAAVSKATATHQTISLKLQGDRQSASLWIWDNQQGQWVSQGITLTRSIVVTR